MMLQVVTLLGIEVILMIHFQFIGIILTGLEIKTTKLMVETDSSVTLC